MTVVPEEVHYLGKQFAVLVPGLLTGCILGVLLDGPDSPKQHVGMLYLIYLKLARNTFYEITYGLRCSIHDTLKLPDLLDSQGQSGKGYEHIAGAALEPRVTGQHVMVSSHLIMELMRSILKTVIEIVTRGALVDLNGECTLQALCLDLRQAGRKDYALALFDGHLKISGHVEILVELISALQLLGVLKLAVPVRTENKLILLAELHVKVRITGIHACLDTVLHHLIVAAGVAVLMCKLTDAAESQKWLETERCLGMRIQKRIPYKYAVFIVLKKFLFLKHDTSYTVYCGRYFVTVEFPYVLMTFGAEIVSPILMQSQVEFGTMLYHGFIQ